jgi:hypothetical protein
MKAGLTCRLPLPQYEDTYIASIYMCVFIFVYVCPHTQDRRYLPVALAANKQNAFSCCPARSGVGVTGRFPRQYMYVCTGKEGKLTSRMPSPAAPKTRVAVEVTQQ